VADDDAPPADTTIAAEDAAAAVVEADILRDSDEMSRPATLTTAQTSSEATS